MKTYWGVEVSGPLHVFAPLPLGGLVGLNPSVRFGEDSDLPLLSSYCTRRPRLHCRARIRRYNSVDLPGVCDIPLW
jgi:hypothetical protein